MRIRTIKPSFFANDTLAELPPLTRILFVGLWCLADVRGRLEDRPKRIKAEVLPYDDHDVDDALNALADSGFVVRYTAPTGTQVLQVATFEKHQRISGKEAESESDFPAPDEDGVTIRTGKHWGSTRETPVENSGSTREPGREGKGKEGEGNEEGKGFTLAAEPVGRGEAPECGTAREKRERTEAARRILEALNRTSGRQYRPTETNLGFIAARLSEEGVDEAGCIRMVQRQCERWLDSNQAEFLRPETLFGKTKFEGYYAARNEPVITHDPRKTDRRQTSTQSDKAF